MLPPSSFRAITFTHSLLWFAGLADTHPDPMHRPQPVGLLLGLVDLPQGLVRPLQDLELVLPEELLLATGKMVRTSFSKRDHLG